MKFCTVFPSFEDVHENKDVGLIPRLLNEKYDVDTYIIYQVKNGNKNKPIVRNGISLIPIHTSFVFLFYLMSTWKILSNNIKIVNLYHFKKETYLYSILLKIIRRKVYVKFDIDNIQFSNLEATLDGNSLKSRFVRLFINCVDLFSIENSALFSKLTENHLFKRKIFIFPNGPSTSTMPASGKDISLRKNKILIVGRLGTEQKNHELVFKWLNLLDSSFEWEVLFAGPSNSNFDNMFAKVKKEKPSLVIKYLGLLERKELFEHYSDSKILLMTSKWEGFSVAMAEAAVMGLYIVTTDVSGVSDLTNNGTLGLIVNEQDMNTKLSSLLTSEVINQQYQQRLTYSNANFLLDNTIERLFLHMEKWSMKV